MRTFAIMMVAFLSFAQAQECEVEDGMVSFSNFARRQLNFLRYQPVAKETIFYWHYMISLTWFTVNSDDSHAGNIESTSVSPREHHY